MVLQRGKKEDKREECFASLCEIALCCWVLCWVLQDGGSVVWKITQKCESHLSRVYVLTLMTVQVYMYVNHTTCRLPACLPACLPAFFPACLSSCLFVTWMTYWLTDWLTDKLTPCLPIRLPTCLPAYLPTYLPYWLTGWLAKKNNNNLTLPD